MYDWIATSTLVLRFVAVLFVRRRVLQNGTLGPLPPGPPGIPWVGNVIGVDPDTPWKTYAEWAKKYGDLIYTRSFGRDVIIINSVKIARDLFDNRSTNYSDRPYLILNEGCGVGFASTFLPYGDRWRLHRRFFHQTFRAEAIPRFLSYQHNKACQFLLQLLNTPEQLDDHVIHYVTTVIMNATYDYEPASRKDDLADNAIKLMNTILPILRFNRSAIIGTCPWLLHLPSWFPGMSFKNEMAEARTYAELHLDRPFQYSLQRESSCTVAVSMVHDALQHMEKRGILPDESWMKELKEASGTAFLGTAETSTSVLRAFFLMMVVHPAVQEKAQAQIDAVLGKVRLPTIGDRPSLPFIDAILWETLRYQPVTPLLFPRVASDDDTYNGFRIPKGAKFRTNLWLMSRDESKFLDAEKFMPGRFLNDDGSLKPNNVDHIAFGFGRRGCPGKHFADASLWGVIPKVLAVFKILPPLDENGVEIQVEPKFSNGSVTRPLPFKCRIVPRFLGMDAEKLERLIAASAV